MDNLLLSGFPIVVRCNDTAVAVYKGKRRVSQGSVDAKLSQGRSKGADNYLEAANAATGHETPDEDVVTCPDKAAGGNITQAGEGGIDLKQAVTRGSILSRQNGGVNTRWQRCHNGRLV